jgi:hypothetical protein
MRSLIAALLLTASASGAWAGNTYNKILTDGTADNILIGGRKQIIGYAPVIASSAGASLNITLWESSGE